MAGRCSGAHKSRARSRISPGPDHRPEAEACPVECGPPRAKSRIGQRPDWRTLSALMGRRGGRVGYPASLARNVLFRGYEDGTPTCILSRPRCRSQAPLHGRTHVANWRSRAFESRRWLPNKDLMMTSEFATAFVRGELALY